MTDNILFSADSYKYTHDKMLPNNTQGVYSYFEARKGSKFPKTVFYGLRAILKKYFVGPVITQELINEADYLITRHIGPGIFNKEGWEYILKKYNGHLPLRIKAVKEGSLIDISNVLMTIENTDDKVPFLTNFAETILTHIWYPITVATTSYYGKLMLTNWLTTTSDKEGEDFNNILNFQPHDFGCRGTENFEASMLGGSAHLLNFNGTDTVPALLVPSRYYNENIDKMFGYSIRATEHSIMTSRGEEGEFGVVEELLNKNPDGIMAMVIDSYNYERFIEVCGTKFKDLILNRNGRIVFRPDSGDIIKVSQRVLELLGQYFGYTVNNKGFKVLPDQVRALWGDGINISDMDRILEESAKNGWSSENWAFGMGGGLLQKINRDTCRFAFKCSAQKYDDKWHDVQKRPLDMSKASKKGRLSLILNEINKYQTIQETSERDILDLVFENGKLIREQTFSEIREIVRRNWV